LNHSVDHHTVRAFYRGLRGGLHSCFGGIRSLSPLHPTTTAQAVQPDIPYQSRALPAHSQLIETVAEISPARVLVLSGPTVSRGSGQLHTYQLVFRVAPSLMDRQFVGYFQRNCGGSIEISGKRLAFLPL
jgi:hypothetical protein